MSEEKEIKKIYRSAQNRIIAGVCGGFGEYLNIDPIIIRLLWIFMILFGGAGILFYIVAWIMMPVNPKQEVVVQTRNTRHIFGILLILIGGIILLSNLNVISFCNWFDWWDYISWGSMIPILLIVIGLLLIFNYFRVPSNGKEKLPELGSEVTDETANKKTTNGKVLSKSITDKKLAGVCGGLAEYLEIDPTIIRLVFVLLILSSFGLGIFLYIILAIVMPRAKKDILEG